MKRYPHTLHRDGLSSSAWTLRGAVIVGRFAPPTRHGPGQYHSAMLRIRYEASSAHRTAIRFQSPRLARSGHRLMGEARLAAPRGVEVRSTGPDEATFHAAIVKGGFFARGLRLVGPDGTIIAVVLPREDAFEIDLNAEACRWTGAVAGPDERKRRVFEAALAMYLAAWIEDIRQGPPERPPMGREVAAAVTRLLQRRPAATPGPPETTSEDGRQDGIGPAP